jgi:hypothetical protein
MTSAINTNGINVNYPVPGINNSSQGFRDNFAAIKTDLNTAATEITDLQNNVVLKQALSGTTLNNDMANTLISNAVTRGFRASTFNLGNAISGTLIVNASLGDVQYGSITGNTTIQFTGWAPSGTQSNVELQLSVANNLAVISLPTQVSMDGGYGIETVENFSNVSGTPTLTIPYGATRVDYCFSTIDCGNTITIENYNRPRQTTQIQQRIPSPIGRQGDVNGTVCVDTATSTAFATCTSTNGTYEIITCDSTAGFYLDMPIQFSGVVFGGVTAGTVYYVRSIPSSTTFTISSVPGTNSGPASAFNLTSASGSMTVSPVSYIYVATGTYDGTTITKSVTSTNVVTNTVTSTNTASTGNLITVSSTANFVIGYPVSFSGTTTNATATATYATSNVITVSTTAGMISGGRITFSGSVFGNLSATTYYIKNIYPGNSNITVSTTFGGANVALTSATGTANITYGNIMGNLSTTTNYFVQSIPSGTTFTVCANTPGGAPVALLDENGSMQVTAVTNYNVTLNSTTSIANNNPIVFEGNVFGGIAANTVYYVANVESGTNITVSQTRYNGIAGQKMALSAANGTASMTAYQGTSIWKRTQLSSW